MKRYITLLLTISLVLTASPVARTQTSQAEQSTANQKVQDWQGMYSALPGTKRVSLS